MLKWYQVAQPSGSAKWLGSKVRFLCCLWYCLGHHCVHLQPQCCHSFHIRSHADRSLLVWVETHLATKTWVTATCRHDMDIFGRNLATLAGNFSIFSGVERRETRVAEPRSKGTARVRKGPPWPWPLAWRLATIAKGTSRTVEQDCIFL